MHWSLGRPANSSVTPPEISWHVSDNSLREYPVKLMTWLCYSRIKLSWGSEVNTSKGVCMLLQEMKSSAYRAIFILHFVCFNRKWAHIYVLSIARGIELQRKYSSSFPKVFILKSSIAESLLPCLTLMLLHRIERAKALWDACRLTCCSVIGEKKVREATVCLLSKEQELTPLLVFSSGGSPWIPVL